MHTHYPSANTGNNRESQWGDYESSELWRAYAECKRVLATARRLGFIDGNKIAKTLDINRSMANATCCSSRNYSFINVNVVK